MLKIVFVLLFDYICCYTFFFSVYYVYYDIASLYCIYSLAGHIPVSISTLAIDVDTGTCSNCLSALLCICTISYHSLVNILPHTVSPCSIAGIRCNSSSFTFTLISSVPSWLFARIAFISNKGAYIKYAGGGGERILQISKEIFAAQETIDLNISWLSNFFRKYFIVPPIKFSFLFKAYL